MHDHSRPDAREPRHRRALHLHRHRRHHRRRAARLRLRRCAPAARCRSRTCTRSRPSASRSSKAGCASASACARVIAGPGDVVEVEPGVAHSFANAGDEEARLRVEVRPALAMEEMFADVIAMAQAGRMSRRGMPRNLLDLALLARTLRPGGPRAAAGRPPPAPPARAAGLARPSPRHAAAPPLPSRTDANICSCRTRPRSCTRTSTRSTRRSSSATTRACAAAR